MNGPSAIWKKKTYTDFSGIPDLVFWDLGSLELSRDWEFSKYNYWDLGFSLFLFWDWGSDPSLPTLK